MTQSTKEFPYMTEVLEDGTRQGCFFTERAMAEVKAKTTHNHSNH